MSNKLGEATIFEDAARLRTLLATDRVVVRPGTTLMISGGAVTATGSYHRVDAAAAANLDTINGGSEGDLLLLRCMSAARAITLRDNVGNLQLAGNFTLDNVQDTILLMRAGNSWLEVSRSNNT